MKRFKVEEYAVFEKGRKYSVLVFPQVKHMWAYDDYPEDIAWQINSNCEGVEYMKKNIIILMLVGILLTGCGEKQENKRNDAILRGVCQ